MFLFYIPLIGHLLKILGRMYTGILKKSKKYKINSAVDDEWSHCPTEALYFIKTARNKDVCYHRGALVSTPFQLWESTT